MKKIVLKQYQDKVKPLLGRFEGISVPPEGWIRTVRNALNMSGVQLAGKLGVTRGLISNTEKAEVNGGVTLKKMQEMAEAMECRFVYAIVPESSIEDILRAQAIKKAGELVKQASIQMALEDQALNKKQLRLEVERLADEMLSSLSSKIWDEK